jgi:hypothetical protein
MLTYAKMAISLLEATGFLTKILIGLGALAALATAYGVWHHEVYESGVKDTIAAIARADAKTVARAVAARAVLKDCQARNLTWDQSTGKCS